MGSSRFVSRQSAAPSAAPWRKAFAKSNQPRAFDMMVVLQRAE
jgi:hypothetical protein